MNNEYIIINKTAIQKRIEELEKYSSNTDFEEQRRLARIDELQEILSQATPLIPEIEKAYFEGECYGIGTDACISKQDYISNLKLDI